MLQGEAGGEWTLTPAGLQACGLSGCGLLDSELLLAGHGFLQLLLTKALVLSHLLHRSREKSAVIISP